MITVDLKKIELNEFFGKNDKTQHMEATFPMLGHHGSKELASVYFEIEPGDHLGRHTDSAEELLFLVEGDVEIEIDGETSIASERSFALVPKMIPHDVKNIGNKKAKLVGFFGGSNHIVASFEDELVPIQTRVVDTSKL